MVIVGTHGGCGKTTLTAGLAASLMDLGIKLSALHPLSFSEQAPPPSTPMAEQAFLDEVLGAYTHHEAISVSSPRQLTVSLWQKVLGQVRRAPYPPLVDTPASLTTPLYEPPNLDPSNTESPPWIDAVGLAQSLLLPVLLVAQATEDLFEEAMPALAYLANHHYGHHHTVGWVTVETRMRDSNPLNPHRSSQDRQIHQISQWTRLPHLGTLPYDPALSVSHKKPSHLIELAQNHLDLLPVQRAFRAYV